MLEEIRKMLKEIRKMLKEIRDLLSHNPNIILYGPPGTSKTYMAKSFAYFVITKDIPSNNKWEDELEIYKLRERLHIVVKDVNKIFIPEGAKDNFAQDDFVLVYKGNGNANIGKLKINGDREGVVKIEKEITIHSEDIKEKLEKLNNSNNNIWLVVKPSGVVPYDYEGVEDIKLKPHDIFRWAIVQFHPAYNYDDFIYGIEAKAEGNNIQYNTVERVLVQISKLAEENPNKEYILIIDEINRANLPAVLGELIYALEYRGKEVNTLYGKTVRIPENLYIIGTMNTADRSAGRIDYAIRRRFTFYPMHADQDYAENTYSQKLMEAVNKFIEEHISPEYDPEDVKIGHTYFIGDINKIAYKFIYQVVPLINEYVQDGLIDLNKSPNNPNKQDDIHIVVENKVIKIKKDNNEFEIKGGKLVKNGQDVDIEEFKNFLMGEWTKLSYALADLIEKSFMVQDNKDGWEKRKLEALKDSAVKYLKSLDDENKVLEEFLKVLEEFSGYIEDNKEVQLKYEGKGNKFTLKLLKENGKIYLHAEYKDKENKNQKNPQKKLQSISNISEFLEFLRNSPKDKSQEKPPKNEELNEKQENPEQPQT
ncbi:MAG: AAA family ATPase [candidate division WOR-3 bacterium]